MDDRPPVWKRTLAAKIARLIETPAVLARFQEMVTSWCEHRHALGAGCSPDDNTLGVNRGIDLAPLPDRRTTIEECYVIFSGLHDSVREDHHINPWRAKWDELARQDAVQMAVKDRDRIVHSPFDPKQIAPYAPSMSYAVLLSKQEKMTEVDLLGLEEVWGRVKGDLVSGGQASQDQLGVFGTWEEVLPPADCDSETEPSDCDSETEPWFSLAPPDENSQFKYPLQTEGRTGSYSKKDIAAWIGIVPKTVEKRCRDGLYHVCKSHSPGRLFQIWFVSSQARSEATEARLAALNDQNAEGKKGRRTE